MFRIFPNTQSAILYENNPMAKMILTSSDFTCFDRGKVYVLSASSRSQTGTKLFGFKWGFPLSRMTANNYTSPMKFCCTCNMSFTLPKQSQRSRSIL